MVLGYLLWSGFGVAVFDHWRMRMGFSFGVIWLGVSVAWAGVFGWGPRRLARLGLVYLGTK